MPCKAVKTMSRMARFHNFDAVFGASPPSAPTFSAAPGGIALFALLPFSLRKLHPPTLYRWEQCGRALIASVILGKMSLIIVGVYGYPPSHPDVATNDELIACALAWAGAQKCCTMVCGDLNVTPNNCPPLAACNEFGMWRISPSKATTRGRESHLSKGLAIDHMMVNSSLLQHVLQCDVRYDISISDHYPVVARFSFPIAFWQSWCPPRRPPSSFPPASSVPPFPSFVASYQEWSEAARKWIARAHRTSIPPKGVVTSTCELPNPPKPPSRCSFLLKVMRSMSHVMKLDQPHPCQVRALVKKLQAVSCIQDHEHYSDPSVMNRLQRP